MKFLYLIPVAAFLFTACDHLVEKKYLSADVSDSSVKKMTLPIDDEEQEFTRTIKPKEPQIVIPQELKQEVSLVLNENLSIKSVLCETAKKLNIDFQIDPTVDSKVIFQAHKKPFIEVLDAICDMADLRYTISGGFVKVIKDTPYTETYDVQFLNLSRDSENKISIATEVSSGTGMEHDSKNHSASSSDSTVTVRTKNDFWSELEEGIKIIIGNQTKDNVTYSINKQSGIITVCANSKKNKQIKDYIQKVKEATTSQVLIEAKIIEIVLKNEYRRGIDWNAVGNSIAVKSEFGKMSAAGLNNAGFHGAPVSLSYKTGKMSSILNALEEFGSMRTISNPRITAMNNQAAVLKVAQNHVYFKLNYDKTYSTTDARREDVAVSSDIKTVPIGLVMFVQPSIDTSNDTITLFLRPTISKLSSTVNDPAVDIAIRSMHGDRTGFEPSKIPVTEVREVASVLKLNDGEIAVLGGFMEVRSSKNKAGVPLAKDLPGVGELTSAYGMGDDVVELVILIKVKIAGSGDKQRAADIRLQRFVPDPRPF